MKWTIIMFVALFPPLLYTMSEPGQEIYERHCIVCHYAGVSGAPKWRDAKDWNIRLTKKTKNELLISALKGLNAMPAKGTCVECNEKDLEAAIQYMLPKS